MVAVAALLATAGVAAVPRTAEAVAAQPPPLCDFSNPFSGAPLSVPFGGIGFGVECDGPGTITFVIAAPPAALANGMGGISFANDGRSPLSEYFNGGLPAGSWWVVSENSPDCDTNASGSSFGTTCATPPVGGADIIATLYTSGPIAALIGNSAGETFTVSDVVVEPPVPPSTTTTSSTTTTTLFSGFASLDGPTKYLTGAALSVAGWASLGFFAVLGLLASIAVRMRNA